MKSYARCWGQQCAIFFALFHVASNIFAIILSINNVLMGGGRGEGLQLPKKDDVINVQPLNNQFYMFYFIKM